MKELFRNTKRLRYELTIPIILAVVLGSYAYFSLPQPTNSMAVPSLPRSAYTPTTPSIVVTEPTGTQSSAGGSSAISSISSRAKDIRQVIVGSLQRGKFETIHSEIAGLVDSYEGYVSTELLTYKDDTWQGEITTRIPQENATDFVFDIRELISNNGKVDSITTEITDITGSIKEGETKPNASIKIALSESLLVKVATTKIPIIDDALPILGDIGSKAIIVLIVGIPTYFGLLGVTLLTSRVLLPLGKKVLTNKTRGS